MDKPKKGVVGSDEQEMDDEDESDEEAEAEAEATDPAQPASRSKYPTRSRGTVPQATASGSHSLNQQSSEQMEVDLIPVRPTTAQESQIADSNSTSLAELSVERYPFICLIYFLSEPTLIIFLFRLVVRVLQDQTV